MHVTGVWGAVGAVITGLIIADVLYHWRGARALGNTASTFGQNESRLLAGRS